MCSCGPCFLWSWAIKFVILNEKKQQFLKLNWQLTGWRQATKANIWGQEIKMKHCEKHADNRMAVKWLLWWNWIPSQGGCFCSMSHFLLLSFQINSLCIDCYDLRGGPQCRRGRRSKWIKRICCKGSWKWRWEEGRWSGGGRGQEGQQGRVNGMCWQGVAGVCWLESGKQVGRWAQGKGYCKQEPGETGKVCQARHRQTDREAQATGSSFITCLLTSFTRISSASLSSSQWGARKRWSRQIRHQIIRSLKPRQLLMIWCTPPPLSSSRTEERGGLPEVLRARIHRCVLCGSLFQHLSYIKETWHSLNVQTMAGAVHLTLKHL